MSYCNIAKHDIKGRSVDLQDEGYNSDESHPLMMITFYYIAISPHDCWTLNGLDQSPSIIAVHPGGKKVSIYSEEKPFCSSN